MYKYEISLEHKRDLEYKVQREAFKTADIVALTTTGVAKQFELLKGTNFPIVIVEEAAEVFEGHILTALS